MIRSAHIKLLSVVILSAVIQSCQSETDGRRDLRMGNKSYNAGNYSKSEDYYLKSIDKEQSIEAFYGRGNSIQRQYPSFSTDQLDRMDSVALQSYEESLTSGSENQLKMSKVYHNMGNLSYVGGLRHKKMQNYEQSNKKFETAAECYKKSLRINPEDDETRYNLAMALYMIEKNKNEQEQQQNQQDKNEENQDKDKNKDKDQDKKDGQDKNKNDEQQNNEKEQEKNQDKEQNKDEQQNNQQTGQNSANIDNRENGKIDEKTANQLLNAAQRDENEVQKKVEKAIVNGIRYEKDW